MTLHALFSRQQARNRSLTGVWSRVVPRPCRPGLEALEDRCLLSTLTVTDPGDTGTNTLRGRIAAAAAGDTINFAPNITFIKLTSASLAITQNGLTIQGPTNGTVTVARDVSATAFSVFNINSGAAATLSHLTITGGSAFTGGGLFNFGTLNLDHAVVTGNTATDGGGLFNANSGTATITNSTFTDNTATSTVEGGGAIDNAVGTVNLVNSTLSGNSAPTGGGGAIDNNDKVTITNSTVAQNTALGNQGGGGIKNNALGVLTIQDSTITNNADAANGGGIISSGSLTLTNTIVALNMAGPAMQGPDIFGAVTPTSNNNFIGTSDASLSGITNGTNSNQIGTTAVPLNPLLGPLQNNGGPTLTRAPLAGSPVIDKGDNAIPSSIMADQRAFNRIVNTTVDIGSVEFQPPDSATTLTVTPNPSAFGQPITFTAHVAGTAPGSNTPTGTVTFMSGSTALGTATVDSSGNATLTTANVPPGSNPVTATYSGDVNFHSSVSAAVNTLNFLQYTPAVFDPATANWFLRNSNTAGTPDIGPFAYGVPGWTPVVGDWNGDGTITIGVVDPATMTWYLRNENSSGVPDVATPFQYGLPGWIPVAGDWGGTGNFGIGAFDPATGTWFLRNEANAGPPDAGTFAYGAPGWLPVVGDWDGDGTFTVGVVNPAGPGGTLQWFLRNSNTAGTPDIGPFAYGLSGWKPIAGDWTAQGMTTIGAVDPSSNTWFLRNSNSAGTPDITPFAYGAPGWTPVSGDWIKPAATTTTTTAATTASKGVSSNLAANLLVTGLRRTQALDQVFASDSLGLG